MNFSDAATLESPFEAEMIKDALEEAEIPFIIRPHRETAYSGLFIDQKGWGTLLASKDNHGECKRILGELRALAAEAPLADSTSAFGGDGEG